MLTLEAFTKKKVGKRKKRKGEKKRKEKRNKKKSFVETMWSNNKSTFMSYEKPLVFILIIFFKKGLSLLKL